MSSYMWMPSDEGWEIKDGKTYASVVYVPNQGWQGLVLWDSFELLRELYDTMQAAQRACEDRINQMWRGDADDS